MRRSRALAFFGWFLTVLAVATVTAGSRAADRMRPVRAAVGATVAGTTSGDVGIAGTDLQFLPRTTARVDDALFGSFVRPGAPSGGLPSEASCPPEMVEVEGDYCPYVEQKCLRWLDPATKLQCAEFDKTVTQAQCGAKTQHKRFCIDRYEWPNKVGALPVYMANWYEAKSSCEATGKRLCSDTEWTLACEGEDRRPYPYGDGYERDAQACNIDKPYIWPKAERIYDPKTASDELARLDQREPSGSRVACVSPYGVHDMVGNVDEWVVNVSQAGKPFQSGLKGGYWGPVRTRCRPMTTAHDETFRYYQIGFRCCGAAQSVASSGPAPLATL
jgi:formylglycine-generating enzyme